MEEHVNIRRIFVALSYINIGCRWAT